VLYAKTLHQCVPGGSLVTIRAGALLTYAKYTNIGTSCITTAPRATRVSYDAISPASPAPRFSTVVSTGILTKHLRYSIWDADHQLEISKTAFGTARQLLDWLHNIRPNDIAAAILRLNGVTRRAATIPVGTGFQMAFPPASRAAGS
jgi:hypothetical protein